ncbi:low molecular weight phosphotyrosine protein phosphatase domain-containing protein [Ditylenchus destructor]|uniref:Low molecular weight phosphotyrosine protein phosphatase n=1 Tax=Ditylenchus destructor TaxID=166010 RepID=A0AAD4MWH7_9BILA|nr:low molecular weight phosphotyrosine protein phosphatase domain-containing protein [Ditylenchus destructor]
MSEPNKSVLFVCHYNICRSPIAEAVFLDLLQKHNLLDEWKVDSAGPCDCSVGSGPEERAVETLKKNGITNYQHTAREVSLSDFREFDYIFGMDEDNVRHLKWLQERSGSAGARAKVDFLGSYDPNGCNTIIADPVDLEGMEPFDRVFKQCLRFCTAFLEQNS